VGEASASFFLRRSCGLVRLFYAYISPSNHRLITHSSDSLVGMSDAAEVTDECPTQAEGKYTSIFMFPDVSYTNRHAGVDLASVQKLVLSSRQPSVFSLLLQLDVFPDPGISQAQFQMLFVRCNSCDLYTTRGAFDYHHCKASNYW